MIAPTFEKWVAYIQQEVHNFSRAELDKMLKELDNASVYGHFDQVKEIIQNEINDRDAEKIQYTRQNSFIL